MTRKDKMLDAAFSRLSEFMMAARRESPEFAICMNVTIASRLMEDAARQAAEAGDCSLASLLIERAAESASVCRTCDIDCLSRAPCH